jgi:hypothetical protein
MGVESATYIDGLTTTWPLSTDQKTQGDDHLRLLKAVLQATFPITGRALRPYRTAAKTGAYSVLATDDMTLFLVNASGGAFNLTLPAVPSVPFRIGVMKIGGDTNAVGFVGTVNGGSAASINYPGQYTEIFGDGTSYHQPLVGMLPNDYVTFARMQNIATDRLIGRDTAASGDPEEVTILQALEWVAALARGDLLTRGALTMGRLAIGAAGRYLRSDGTDPLWALPYAPLFHIRKESSSGTNGQNMTAATWNQLALDATVQNQITGASLGTNEFTLPAGTFRFTSFPGFRGSDNGIECQARLRNTTDGTTTLRGATFDSGNGGGAIFAPLWGDFTIAAPKTFQIQLWVSTGAGTAQMQASSSGEGEVYNETQIEQIG